MNTAVATTLALVVFMVPLVSVASTEMTSEEPAADYRQLFTVEAGPYQPNRVQVSNGNYAFQYRGDSLQSFLVQVGWSARLFKFLGSVSIEERLGYTNLAGLAGTSQLPNSQGDSLSLNILSLDNRIMHSWDWFPWKPLIPFIDGGYQLVYYHQGGSSDLESAQGTVGNFVAGGGLRFWVNYWSSKTADHVHRYEQVPIFITARVSRIFPSGSDLDLSSTVFQAGLSIGL